MLAHRPTSIAECEERIERVRQARRECLPNETELLRTYDDMLTELIACRVALIPSPRGSTVGDGSLRVNPRVGADESAAAGSAAGQARP